MDLEIEPISGTSRPRSAFAVAAARWVWTLSIWIGVLWLVFFADRMVFGGQLVAHGIRPRTIDGLLGVVWAPFLHGSWSHLIGNTFGFVILGGIVLARSVSAFWVVTFLGALSCGAGTWLFGRANAVHAGASGVIFAYFGYLLFAGIFERRIGSLLLSLVVFLLWGGMLWQALPTHTAPTISWEGHLFGLAGGILAAKLLAAKKAQDTGPGALPGSQ